MAFKPSSFLRIGNYMTSPRGFAFCVGRQEAKLLHLTIAVTQPGIKMHGKGKIHQCVCCTSWVQKYLFFFS